MKIGIIGSGIAGKVSAKAFTNEGHGVHSDIRNTLKTEVVRFKEANLLIYQWTHAFKLLKR